MEIADTQASKRLAAVRSLAARAWTTFERFPLVLLCALAAAVILHHLTNIDFAANRGADAFYPLLMASALGISLFVALRLLGESRGISRRARHVFALAGLVVLVGYYASLPVPVKGADVFRFFVLAAALHLAVAFLPFTRRASTVNGFWQYNRVLFLRFAAAVLYSGVLYVGLALAIAACENLLDLDFNEEIYLQLWFWVVFAYNTWFFLAGIPKPLSELERREDYPTALRIFTQYVLIPLVVIYLIILYAYTAKILIEWNLPKGWVAYPVIGIAVTGMLALLLVHPIRARAGYTWIATYARLFYWALFPLIVLIAVAIGTRLGDYGITERRYAVVVATAWLLGIAVYFSVRRAGDIRIIPVSLCVVTALASFGPWGATSVSKRSQLGRLRDILVSEEVMVGGVLSAAGKRVEFDRQAEISNILKYLYDFHGLAALRSWYAEPGDLSEELTPQLAMQRMGLRYLTPWEARAEGDYSVNAKMPNPIPLEGFDFLYDLRLSNSERLARMDMALDSVTRLSLSGTTLELARSGEPLPLQLQLEPTLSELREQQLAGKPRGVEIARLAAEDERFRFVFYLLSATVVSEGDSIFLRRLQGNVLVDVK